MRFQTQIIKLREANNLLELNAVEINNGAGFNIKNALKLSKGINIIEKLDYLNPELNAVKELGILNNLVNDTITVNRNTYGSVVTAIESLKRKIVLNLNLLNSTIVEVDDSTICIKLIEYKSLDQIGNELKQIDKIITQAITHEKISGTYEFLTFDIGSSWIYITLSSALALNFIAGLVWAACVIRKKWLEGTYLEKTIEQMNIKNESLRDIQDANKKQLDRLLESEAKNLMKEFDLDNTNNEYENRLIYSIKELSQLVNNGVQIQPSLLVKEDSKNLFPDYGKLDLIESKIKLLEKQPNAHQPDNKD